MLKPKGLGKGLGSLIPNIKLRTPVVNTDVSEEKSGVLEVPIGSVVPNPQQPRQQFLTEDLAELVESVKKYGILQPLLVTQKGDSQFELIAGERRLRAAKQAGLQTVPVLVRTAGDLEKLELAIIENIQRKDLNPIEKAESYYRLVDEFSLTQEEAAKRLGISRPALANTIRLLTLPSAIQQALLAGKISEGHGRAILALDSAAEQMKLFEQIINYGFNVRETESQIAKSKIKNKKSLLLDSNLEAKKNTLEHVFNTKVDIKKSKHKGQVVFHFYSDEEFNALLDKLSKTV